MRRVKTGDLRPGDHIRVVFGPGLPQPDRQQFDPARNIRDSVAATVVRVEHMPGWVPGAPYRVTVRLSDGTTRQGYFPSFQTHLPVKQK